MFAGPMSRATLLHAGVTSSVWRRQPPYIGFMVQRSPAQDAVLTVTSRLAGVNRREFTVEATGLKAPVLPPGIEHENDLVDFLRRLGFQLSMVGGGSRTDELRRFYFRPKATR